MSQRNTLYEEGLNDLIAAFALDTRDAAAVKRLNELKSQMLRGDEVKRSATDFGLEEAINRFRLKCKNGPPEDPESVLWEIEDACGPFPDIPTITVIARQLKRYAKNFNPSGKAVCRTVLEIVLNECLSAIKGDTTLEIGEERPKTPTPWDDIQIHAQVSFNHKIPPPSKSSHPPQTVIITGSFDYGIGHQIIHAVNQRRCTFHTLLVVIEAKMEHSTQVALPRIIVYLACLWHSRTSRSLSGSVSGVVSDGFQWIFVTITEDGTVKISRMFDLLIQGDVKNVLGCLTYIIQTGAKMIPNTTLEKIEEV